MSGETKRSLLHGMFGGPDDPERPEQRPEQRPDSVVISADAKYIASRITRTLWIIFVGLPVVALILFLCASYMLGRRF